MAAGLDSGADVLAGLTAHLQDSTSNSSSQEQADPFEKAFSHDEFFQKEEDVPVSETFACKKMLFTTLGTSAVKTLDVCLLVPGLLTLFLLAYTSPRSRQKLSGSSLLVLALHLAIWTTTTLTLLRALITIALPTEKDSSNILEKVTWALSRAGLLALELTAIANILLSFQASGKASKRILASSLLIAAIWFTITTIIELLAPSPAFHLFELGYNLYGEGGGLYTVLTAGCLCFLLTLALAVRVRQHKSTPGRNLSLWFVCLLLAVHGVRVVGGLLLVTGIQGGMCLTSVSLYLETAGLPSLVFCLLLLPILRNGQGHSLLAYSVHKDDWDETETAYRREYRDNESSPTIVRNENSVLQDEQDNTDDY